MYKKILVPIDGSKQSLVALDHAAHLQQDDSDDSEMILLCVFKHHSLFEASLSMVRPEEVDLPDDALREYATTVAEHAREMAIKAGAKKVRAFVKGALRGWQYALRNPAEAADGTVRKDFAESLEANSVHGSDSPDNAQIEIRFFFSDIEIVG